MSNTVVAGESFFTITFDGTAAFDITSATPRTYRWC
jgi:hypothetical protein